MDIKSVIKKKGFTIVGVAKKIPTSQVNLTRILGSPDVKVSTLRKIAAVLHCDIAEFFADETSHHGDNDSAATIECPHCGNPIRLKAEK